MKLQILTILLIPFFAAGQQGTLTVVYKRGHVVLHKTHAPVENGQLLSLTDTLEFSALSDFVSVYGGKQQRRVIIPDPRDERVIPVRAGMIQGGHPQHEFLTSVGERIVPSADAHFLAYRAAPAADTTAIKNYLLTLSNGSYPVVIPGFIDILLVKAGFSDTAHKVFFIRYLYHGETINKRLTFASPRGPGSLSLRIDHQLFTVDGKTIDQNEALNQRLFFYDIVKEFSQPVCAVNFRLVTKAELIAAVRQIKAVAGPGATPQLIYSELLTDFGAVDSDTFQSLIK